MKNLEAYVRVSDNLYEVHTCSMNEAGVIRNEMFGINCHAETMIWETLYNPVLRRTEEILGCHRYKNDTEAINGHKGILIKLTDGDLSVFNGDGFSPEKMKVNTTE